MKKLLQLGDNYHWNLEGIEFAIEERVGNPQNFIGRMREMEYLYGWTKRIQIKRGKSISFLGRRKVGKSLMLERLYNILYSEQRGLIPFFYEFSEGRRSGKEFYIDFIIRFYMQVVGYYTRDITWIRKAVRREKRIVNIETLLEKIAPLSFQNKEIILEGLEENMDMLKREQPLYEYVLAVVAVPHGFATTPGVEDKVVQMLDEFQYMNMYIDAGVVDKPCMAYMSTAESKVAPLLVTGSLIHIVAQELARYLPQRFNQNFVPKMNHEESIVMTLNYGQIYGHNITLEIATYIAYITNGIPGRIEELLDPTVDKPQINTFDDVDHALELEVGGHGTIKQDWDEYLIPAMDEMNDVNMRRIAYFLCKHEGTWYYPRELRTAMSLDIEDKKLRQELELLFKYDIIEMDGGRYGGVFDRTLKKVLMKNYADLFNLPSEAFNVYFKNDSMLDYLKERAEQLEIGLAEMRDIQKKLTKLRGEHNNLKGHYYEREVLLRLIKDIIDSDGGLVEGISVTAFTYMLNYHMETGEEIDIVLEGEQVVIMVECKNYIPDNLDRISTTMVDNFIDKATRLYQSHFADKELRLGFFSRYGFEKKMEQYLTQHGIVHKVAGN
ncbi:MAG: hypothetical protein B6242_14310 [Anaerolineaceae bacterium 4572_78]|nr:MAG: hypothetical protein B6242_14310 [Anaerolineaceae bacterium 4572_78]